MTSMGSTAKNFYAGQARRKKYLAALHDGANREEAAGLAGISDSTYRQWRKRFKDFAAECDSILNPGQPIKTNGVWTQGFAQFRKTFFGHDSPWFHLRIIQALEEGEPGSVTLITIPPEHGKTTTIEDYCSYKLALDPLFRITVGSEKQMHSRKVIRRVKNRMEGDGPSREYVHRFGPFKAPARSSRSTSQPWSADYFDVFKKGSHDERDYSMVALGMGSAVAGTRTDLLIADDPQSRKSLNSTEELFQIFRQDWLSRPGSKGRTVILMTRQGEGDFAEALMNSEILDYHIVLPAWSDTKGWLWPERYTEHEYERMRRNVGQEAWERNYLQIARPEHTIVFTRETIQGGRDTQRSILNIESPDPKPWPIIIGLDPGYNVAGFSAAIAGEKKFQIVEARKRWGLAGTEAIIAELEDLVARCHLPGHHFVSDLVIESMAFQKGLLTDARIIAMQKHYGFRIHPHQTGDNKYDPDLGVPQMVHSLLREEITWPWGDEVSRRELKELEEDMYRWRPKVRGTRLEQDVLMATWFIWLRWRQQRRNAKTVNTNDFRFRPAPRLGARV